MRALFWILPLLLVILLLTPESYLGCLAVALAVPEAIGCGLIGIWAVWQKKWHGLLWVGAAIVAAYFPMSQPLAEPGVLCGNPVSVLQANVLQKNSNPQKCLLSIAAIKADIVVLHEINQQWKPLIDNILSNYSFKMYHIEADTECCYGMGILSRFPIVDSLITKVENIAVLRAQTGGVTLITTHLRNPTKLHKYRSSKRQLAAIAAMLDTTGDKTVFVGDFNAVPWGKNLHAFMLQSGLVDTRTGLQPTFHSWLPVLPIDYVMVKGGIQPLSSQTLSLPGSDHLAILALICP